MVSQKLLDLNDSVKHCRVAGIVAQDPRLFSQHSIIPKFQHSLWLPAASCQLPA
jgi:hypothetical protein